MPPRPAPRPHTGLRLRSHLRPGYTKIEDLNSFSKIFVNNILTQDASLIPGPLVEPCARGWDTGLFCVHAIDRLGGFRNSLSSALNTTVEQCKQDRGEYGADCDAYGSLFGVPFAKG